MTCPRCATPLERIDLAQRSGEYTDVTIDRCPACGGTWYDRGELDANAESAETDVEHLPLQHVEAAAPLTCPRCGSSMSAVTVQRLSDLVLDRCPSCAGFWLDAGELPALQAYVGSMDSGTSSRVSESGEPAGTDQAELLLFVVGDDVVDDQEGH